MRFAFVYHERYAGRGLAHARLADSWTRYAAIYRAVRELGLPLAFYRQSPAALEVLHLVHPPDYVEWVRRMDLRAEGFLDRRDTPAYRGIFKRARIAVGGTVLAARLIAEGVVERAFNPGGGLHHARARAAGGFCVFNDLVIAVRLLMKEYGYRRPAIIDLDGHHGDGTQELLYHEPILTVSLHQYDGRFYPGTGRLEERGEGAGLGYCLNVPLPRRTSGAAYLRAFDEIVVPAVRAYRPDFLIVQGGVDAHFADRLVGLRLTTYDYQALAEHLDRLAGEFTDGRLLVTGGGGYTPEATVRCWAVLLGMLAGVPARVQHLHDTTQPRRDFAADVQVDRIVKAFWQQEGALVD